MTVAPQEGVIVTQEDRGAIGKPDKPLKEIKFTIDGVEYSTADREQPARDLIALTGLDPAMFDLAELHGNSDPKSYADDQMVKIQPGDKFVTVRQTATVG